MMLLIFFQPPYPPLGGEMAPFPSVHSFALVLNKCKSGKNPVSAMHLFFFMRDSGTDAHQSLGDFLVSTLLAVESTSCAQQVFDRLPYATVSSWNSLIIDYAKHGEWQRALFTYFEMHEGYLHGTECAFLALLKACAELEDVHAGCRIHMDIVKRGLERHLFLGSTLVNMYAKCGFPAKAREVFDQMPVKDTVSWNTLLAGYVSHGYDREFFDVFGQMRSEGIIPSKATFLCSLKAYSRSGTIDEGQAIHVEISRRGLENDTHIGCSLVDMYANFGTLGKAQEIFETLPIQNAVAWNALISGFVKHEHSHEALDCYEQMQYSGILKDETTFVCSVKACGIIAATDKGQVLHVEIVKKGFESDLFIGSALVDMYVNCGWFLEAQESFDRLHVRNIITWNTLISGYAKYGYSLEALDCTLKMRRGGFLPNVDTYACNLRACAHLETSANSKRIHAEVITKGLETDVLIGCTVVDAYANSGLLVDALKVFESLPTQDVVSWTVLIAGYVKHGLDQKALDCFQYMQTKGVSPNTHVYSSIVKACGNIGAKEKGQEIHSEIAYRGLLETDLILNNALIDMYVKFDLLKRAQEAFDQLIEPDVVSWNVLIGGYAKHGYSEEVFTCFMRMKREGFTPDAITYASVLNACGLVAMIDTGKDIHAEMENKGLLQSDLVIGNTLVDMYANGGLLVKACEVFDDLLIRDVVSWTSLITGYVKCECCEEALNCFEYMRVEGIFPNSVTFVCILKVFGSMGAMHKGQCLHAEILKRGTLEEDPAVGNSLVDMYAKCGLLSEARKVLHGLPVPDSVSWNALITGYAQLGVSKCVFNLLEKMIEDDQVPSTVTFVSVLNACSHTGLVPEGLIVFQGMVGICGTILNLEHYVCIIDMFGRAGQLENVTTMIKQMPFHPNHVAWHSILNASRKWGDMELGKQAFAHAIDADNKDAAAFLCISSMYANLI